MTGGWDEGTLTLDEFCSLARSDLEMLQDDECLLDDALDVTLSDRPGSWLILLRDHCLILDRWREDPSCFDDAQAIHVVLDIDACGRECAACKERCEPILKEARELAALCPVIHHAGRMWELKGSHHRGAVYVAADGAGWVERVSWCEEGFDARKPWLAGNKDRHLGTHSTVRKAMRAVADAEKRMACPTCRRPLRDE